MNTKHATRRWPRSLLLAALIPALLLLFLTQTRQQITDEGLRRTDEAVRRAAVECYALEGAYPDSLDYLCEHYALSPDRERYFIAYQYMGDNLMPDITVLPVTEDAQLAQEILGEVTFFQGAF